MKIRNNLRILMAKKQEDSLLKLSHEIEIPYGTLLNFYHQRFQVFNGRLVTALCKHFDCKIEDLLELVDEKVS